MDRTSGGWVNHPCTNMWRNNKIALAFYGLVICNEWVKRGYKDTMTERFMDILSPYSIDEIMADMPDWLGREDIHASHRSNLLHKEPMWYNQFNWSESDDLPYVWPV
jgi:Pyrimidine dimer DNA glycosylase